MSLLQRISGRIKRQQVQSRNYQRINSLSGSIKRADSTKPDNHPILFFNASTRLQGLSLNAAFSLLSSYGIQLAGTPVIHLVCYRGLSHCVLGTNNHNVTDPPPCAKCIQNSKALFSNQQVSWFEYLNNPKLSAEIENYSLAELIDFKEQGCPLGELVLPSLRWILRRHHLVDDESTRYMAREYINSSHGLLQQIQTLLVEVKPQAVVVFNGMFYPEAVVRWAARQKNIPVISHEVGMQPFSAFFTFDDATAYPITLPKDFQLSPQENHILDDYLSRRFQGDFSTAGIKFWPEIKELGPEFWDKASRFKHFVPIFTNVIFDTSQSHANVIFPDMFAWLDEILEQISKHPDTLFVIRAHPDELRPGKESRESVSDWVNQKKVTNLPNITFIDADEMISSYELIEHAKFVMVYNSTVGLEAAIKGKPVLCGGKARYTQMETVYLPKSRDEFHTMFSRFLVDGEIHVPRHFIENARKMLYAQFFIASLPFDNFLESDGIWNGFVTLKDFSMEQLRPENSPTIKIITDGILHHQDFLLKP